MMMWISWAAFKQEEKVEWQDRAEEGGTCCSTNLGMNTAFIWRAEAQWSPSSLLGLPRKELVESFQSVMCKWWAFKLKISSLVLTRFWDIFKGAYIRSQIFGLTPKLCNFQKLVIRYKDNCPELLQLWLGPLSLERKTSFQLELW